MLQVDGVGLEARWWGDGREGRAPIALLHEGLGCVAAWRDFPGALAARTGRRVLAYSRQGYGQSDRRGRGLPVSFMHDEARDVLPRVLDAAGLDRVVLFGHSDGGSIALLAAAAHPGRVEALVLEAPHVFVEDLSIESIARMRHRYAATDLRVRLARFHAHVDEAFRGWNDVWLDPAFRAWNIEEVLPAIQCPLLVLQGIDDEYGTLRQVEAIAHGVAGPVETVVLDACGHSPHRDQPEAVLAAAARFLEVAGRPQLGA